jgi:hypothetical protein
VKWRENISLFLSSSFFFGQKLNWLYLTQIGITGFSETMALFAERMGMKL